MKRIPCFRTMCGAFFALLIWVSWASAEPWSFGVIADTQWAASDDGRNPNTVAADIIKQVDREFIQKGVKFVIAVGDTANKANKKNLDTRALYAQDLYNAGIGFYPLRGNHESMWKGSGPEFARIYPQTQTGMNNSTPGDIPPAWGIDTHIAPDAKTGSPFPVGANFSSPNPTINGVSARGLTYSFDYDNARFVILDQFDNSGRRRSSSTIPAQQPWITGRLSDPNRPRHAFVFGHKGIIGAGHPDNLFGSDPAADPASTDAFINSLANNGVRYYICGHDHLHNRSVVTSTDGVSAKLTEIISSSDSSKFYSPPIPSNDTEYDIPAFGHTRQTPVSQDLYRIGYYIYTVDGPRVTAAYYAAPSGQVGGDIHTTPPLTGNWQKRETFGYSLNGREFLIAAGKSYATIRDNFHGTTARILYGINSSTATDGSGRPFTKAVNTGWSPKTARIASNILTLWGMARAPGSDQTDVYTLSMSYDPKMISREGLKKGLYCLVTKGVDGRWTKAVARNFGGVEKFVSGAWKKDYGLGAYGVDTKTNTAWAVINFSGEFAVAGYKHRHR